MRDELDNAMATSSLIKRAGMGIISHAKTVDDEDTFLLGPDLLEQIERKRQLMLDHWCDAEEFLFTPNK